MCVCVRVCVCVSTVKYQTDNFLDKNKDFIVAEHQTLMSSSGVQLVGELFGAQQGQGGDQVRRDLHNPRHMCIHAWCMEWTRHCSVSLSSCVSFMLRWLPQQGMAGR